MDGIETLLRKVADLNLAYGKEMIGRDAIVLGIAEAIIAVAPSIRSSKN